MCCSSPQRLPKVPGQAAVPSIMLAEYPKPVASRDVPQLELDLDDVQTIVTRTRKLRSDYGLVKQKPKLFLTTIDAGGRVGGWVGGRADNPGEVFAYFVLPS